MTCRRTLLSGLLMAASLTLGAAPAISPAVAQQGGDRAAPGITAQEAQLGREQHKQVLAQFGGAYDDPKLQAYVKDVGERLKDATECTVVGVIGTEIADVEREGERGREPECCRQQ